MSGASRRFGALRVFSCNKGYQLKGPKEIVCQHDLVRSFMLAVKPVMRMHVCKVTVNNGAWAMCARARARAPINLCADCAHKL